jgi:SP family facilitated glucose transporter-like MFS transporter 8
MPLLATPSEVTGQGVVRMFLTTFAAALGAVCFGYALGYASPVTTDLQRGKGGGKREVLSSEAMAWFGSIINIGAMIGALVGGKCAEKFGRKTSIMVACLPFAVGWLLVIMTAQMIHSIGSHIIYTLCVGRVLSGLGLGMISVTVPIYIAEMSTATYRGFLGTSNQVAITIGVLLAYVLGIWIKPYYWLAVAAMIVIAVLIVFMLFVPETPRWLLMDGQQKEALKVLQWLRGDKANIANEFSEIERSLQDQEEVNLSEFRHPSLLKPLRICIMLMIFQQFCGINSVLFFASVIFKSAHSSHSLEPYEPTLIGVVQVIATVIAGFLMDRLGRRVLLIISGSLLTISSIGLGVFFKINNLDNNNIHEVRVPWLALLCLGIYITGFSLGFGPIPWLIMSEILPTRVRGTAGGITVVVSSLCSFLITYLFHHFTDSMQYYGTFWFYGGVSLLGTLYIVTVVPETKGKTLEEIEEHFD